MARPIRKISVLSNGDVLFDGALTTLADVAAALDSTAEKPAIWYYRENPGHADPPPIALEVLKIVAARGLPVRLFAKADFSDVEPVVSNAVARVFAAARERASQGQLIIVRPDYRLLGFPAVPKESMAKQAIDEVERILPSCPSRNIAVLVETGWSMGDKPALQTAAESIPFMGLLIGLTCIGHAVWAFGPSEVAPACKDADLLIVDEALVSHLAEGWASAAKSAMRTPKVVVYGRERRQLTPIR